MASLSRVPFAGGVVRAYIDRRWPGARTSAVARTCFIDDAVEKALGSAAEQVVILGAGFDARAYRIPAMARATAIFEVDHPSTSAAKRTIVQARVSAVRRQVQFVPLDFNSDSLQGAMSAAGYDPRRRALFIWEGVTNYLLYFGLDPARLSEFLLQRGLELSEDVGASDYRALYFGAAARRMRGY